MKRELIFFLSICTLLTGCIKNDIPYPTLVSDITAFEIEGQLGTSIINTEGRSVIVELRDTVNPERVRLTHFEVSNNATISPSLTAYIDLSSPLIFTLSTYPGQNYTWTITANQTIERYMTVSGQVGETQIDVNSKIILIKVSAGQALDNITILSMKLGPEGSVITPDPASVTDFSRLKYFDVSYSGITEEWCVRIVQSSANTLCVSSVNAWATFANIEGLYISNTPGLEYKTASASDWIRVADSCITGTSGKFSAKISALSPETDYTVRACEGESVSSEYAFTTETAAQISNSSFDRWYQSDPKNAWYPNISADDIWWDTANGGANALSTVNPTVPDSSFVAVSGEGKKAAKLESKSVFGVLAAGNIYTGKFKERSGTSALLDFGVPFTSRPTAMKGYYCYAPKAINKTKKPYEDLAGRDDYCQIYCMLTDWDTPFAVNSGTATYVDPINDKAVIAYGEIVTNESSNGQYKAFTIPLVYRDFSRKPAFCVIVACSSRYGDYYTGGIGSVLYVDEFELVYE